MGFSKEQIEKMGKMLKNMFPEENYKPDFSFRKRGKEELDYKRKVEEAITKNAEPITRFSERPRPDELIRGAPIGALVTRVYEIKQEGVVFYHVWEGLLDTYASSVKLLGFKENSEIYLALKKRLEKLASEGDKSEKR